MVVSFLPAPAHYSKILSTHVLCNHLNQWFPKSGLRPKKESRWVKNWVAPRRSKLQLDIFNVTTASLSVCSIGTWKTSRLLTLKTDLATYCQKSSTQLITFFIHCLRHRSRGVHRTQIWVALKKFGNGWPKRFRLCCSKKGWISSFFYKTSSLWNSIRLK